jgi:hypothetical protein
MKLTIGLIQNPPAALRGNAAKEIGPPKKPKTLQN